MTDHLSRSVASEQGVIELLDGARVYVDKDHDGTIILALESPEGDGMMMRLSQPVAAYLAGMLTARAEPEHSESLADAVVEAIHRAKASVNTGEKWTVTLPFHNWAKIVRLAEERSEDQQGASRCLIPRGPKRGNPKREE